MSPTAHRVLLPLLAPRERPVTAHHYGMWVVNLPPRQCTQYSSITASHHERERKVYMPLNHKYFHKIFSFCIQFPSFLCLAWFLVAPLMQVRGQPHCNLSILELHSRAHISHLLHRYSFKFLLLSFMYQKVSSNDNTKAFWSYCAWELNILSVALQTVLQWAMLLKG